MLLCAAATLGSTPQLPPNSAASAVAASVLAPWPAPAYTNPWAMAALPHQPLPAPAPTLPHGRAPHSRKDVGRGAHRALERVHQRRQERWFNQQQPPTPAAPAPSAAAAPTSLERSSARADDGGSRSRWGHLGEAWSPARPEAPEAPTPAWLARKRQAAAPQFARPHGWKVGGARSIAGPQ